MLAIFVRFSTKIDNHDITLVEFVPYDHLLIVLADRRLAALKNRDMRRRREPPPQ